MRFAVSGMRRAVTAACALCLAFVLVCTSASADPALWKVEGGPEPVWLFGTFHLLPPETEWQTPALDAAFEESDVLVIEVRLDAQGTAAAQKLIAEKAFLKGGKRLRDYLDSEDREILRKVGNRLGLFPAVLDHFRPWYASILLSAALALEQGFHPNAGADYVLEQRARRAGMPVEQLETASQQLNFLADMSMEEQVDMLKATLREAETVPEQLDIMLRAWRDGDTEAMNTLLNDSVRQFPELYERMLVRRNRTWMQTVVPMIEDGKSYFIAVGSAHLVGEDSVVAMLREKGYEVTGP